MQAPEEASAGARSARARWKAENWRSGASSRGVIAARTISTIADYPTTDVSGQENVRVMFCHYLPRDPRSNAGFSPASLSFARTFVARAPSKASSPAAASIGSQVAGSWRYDQITETNCTPHLHVAGLRDQIAVFGQGRSVPLEIDDALEPRRIVRIRRACCGRFLISLS
jgi:hypothetical protein